MCGGLLADRARLMNYSGVKSLTPCTTRSGYVVIASRSRYCNGVMCGRSACRAGTSLRKPTAMYSGGIKTRDTGGAGAVDIDAPLPASWLAFALPAGSIAAGVAQLAMLRGEAFVHDAASGRGLVGGRVLVGMAGGAFAFASAETAALWASINLSRAKKELALVAALPAVAAMVWRETKRSVLEKRAGVLLRNAQKITGSVAAALIVESNWCTEKWAEL